jgi:hypothetical protein
MSVKTLSNKMRTDELDLSHDVSAMGTSIYSASHTS